MSLKSKLQASAIHLAISALVAGAAAVLVFLIWYPPPLATMQGVDALVILMVAVDVVLGPLLTFVVFQPGKRSLRLDLAVIGLLQAGALLYGLHVIYLGRPALIVFNVDRFDVVTAADVDADSYRRSLAQGQPPLPHFGPAWRAAFAPTEVEARNALIFSTLNGGPDLPQRPDLQRAYPAAQRIVGRQLLPLEWLRNANALSDADWRALLAACGPRPVEDLGYLPLIAKARDGVVIASRDGTVIGIRLLKPALHAGPASAPARGQ